MALITFPALFLLAQAVTVPTSGLPADMLAASPPNPVSAHKSTVRTRTAPTSFLSPQVRITIVNATSVPLITLSTKGTSLPAAYPFFPQGTWTADAPLKTPTIHYVVRGNDGRVVGERLITFQAVSSQILLLTGDLSTSGPADKPPQLGLPPLPDSKPWPPNLQFHVYPCDTNRGGLCRYRVVNGMPSRLLVLRSVATPNRPSEQLALLAPGDSALFVHQPSNLQWEAEIDGKIYTVALEQEGDAKNCLIPFFLRDGQPDFIRVFEDP